MQLVFNNLSDFINIDDKKKTNLISNSQTNILNT